MSWEPEEAESRAAFLLGSLLLGIAVSVKYNGITLAAVTFGLAAVFRARREGVKAATRIVVLGALLAGAVGLPVYLRNLIMLGSPIYPPPATLARFFPGRAFPWQASVDFQSYIADRGRGFGHGLIDLVLLPIRFTYAPATFHGAGGIGLVPLAFLPARLIEPASRPLRYAAAWMVANTCVWFAIQQEARFLAPVVILATAAAVGVPRMLVRTHSRAGGIAFGLASAISVLYGGGVFAKTLVPVAASTLSPSLDAQRWTREVPHADALDRLNALAPKCRVLILDKFVMPYYLHCQYLKLRGQYGEEPMAGDPLNDARFSSPDATTLDLLRRAGITHILDTRLPGQEFEYFEPLPPNVAETFRSQTARILRLDPESG